MGPKAKNPHKRQKTTSDESTEQESVEPLLSKIAELQEEVNAITQLVSKQNNHKNHSVATNGEVAVVKENQDNSLALYPYLYYNHCSLLVDYQDTINFYSDRKTEPQNLIETCFSPLKIEEWTEWNQTVDQIWNNELKTLNQKGSIFVGRSHIEFLVRGLQKLNSTTTPAGKNSIKRLVYLKVEFPASEVVEHVQLALGFVRHYYKVPKPLKEGVSEYLKALGFQKRVIGNPEHYSKTFLSHLKNQFLTGQWTVPEPDGCFATENELLVVSTYVTEYQMTESSFENFQIVAKSLGPRMTIMDAFLKGKTSGHEHHVWNDFCKIVKIVIQMYSHMITYGAHYGYATSERGYLFLHVTKSNLQKVYYHYLNNTILPPSLETSELDMENDNGQLKETPLMGLITILLKAYDASKIRKKRWNQLRRV